MRILDLFCGAGGASMGTQHVGEQFARNLAVNA